MKDHATGWTAGIGRISVVIGCLSGGLAAIVAAIALYQLWVVRPDVHLTLVGDNIDIRWDAHSGRVSFDCLFVATNEGRAGETLRAMRAHLATARGMDLALGDVSLRDSRSGSPLPSFSVKQGEPPLELLVTLTLPLDGQNDRLFRQDGVHQLVVEFEGPQHRTKANVTACFWFGEPALAELIQNGLLPTTRYDPGCQGNSDGN